MAPQQVWPVSKPKHERVTEPCHVPLRLVVATSQGTDPQAHPAEGEAPALPELGSTWALPTLSCVWNFPLRTRLVEVAGRCGEGQGRRQALQPSFITDPASSPARPLTLPETVGDTDVFLNQ